MKRQARQRAALLGAGDALEEKATVWVIDDPRDARFGEVLDEQAIENPNRFVHMRSMGVISLDGVERLIVNINREERGDWMRDQRERGVDIRTIGDHRSRLGRRDVDFRDAVEMMEHVELADAPDLGPRAMGEFLASVATGSGNLVSCQAEWERLSGVSAGGTQNHEHRICSCSLMRAVCLDQLNANDLHCMEVAVRRIIQIKMAVQRNPRHPDFSGLEDVVAGPTAASGPASVPKYLERVVARQKDRAHILKQMRLRRTVGAVLVKLEAVPSAVGVDKARRVRPRGEPPTAVQRSVLEFVQERIDFFGNPPCEAVDGERSLREILGSTGQCELGPQHLAGYDVAKLWVCKGDIHPVPVVELLPAEAAGFPRHYQNQIELTEPEVADRVREAGVCPGRIGARYFAAMLSCDVAFSRRLAKIGIVGFRRAIKSRCGACFVRERDGDILFICDARATNMCHRPPPRTVLGGAACISEIDLSGYAASLGGVGGVCEPHFSGADIKDCFYQLANEEMGGWFGFDSALRLEDWDLDFYRTWGDSVGGWTPAVAGEMLCPCLRVLPMGWAWALYFAQEVVSNQVRASCLDGDRQLLRGKRPAPLLRLGKPPAAVHVDNFTGVGGSAADAAAGVGAFQARAAVAGPGLRAASIAVQALLKRGRASGPELRTWAGRAVALLGLQPCLLSLQEVCHFVGGGSRRRAALPPLVRGELRMAAVACLLTEVDLGAPLSDEVHASDSSSGGFSLTCGRRPFRAVWGAHRWRERWRFVEVGADSNTSVYTRLTSTSSMASQTASGLCWLRERRSALTSAFVLQGLLDP
ncbi:unnamed protein product, partial [Prorocentrum cordatum]